jgi:hypothetical protein
MREALEINGVPAFYYDKLWPSNNRDRRKAAAAGISVFSF